MLNFSNKTLATALLAAIFLLTGQASAQADDTARAVELFQKGQNAHEKGELAAAIGLYNEALELLPEFPEAQLQLGSAYLSLSKDKEAEAAFRKALELREEWSLASAALGSVLVKTKRFEEASGLLERSIASDPANPLALSAMADLLIATEAPPVKLQSLLDRLNLLAGKARPTVSLLTAKAVIEEKLNHWAAAKDSASRALQIDPRSRAAHFVLAEIALKENDLEKADGHVRSLESSASGSAEVIVLRARVLYGQGRRSDALAALETFPAPTDRIKELIAKVRSDGPTDIAGLESKLQRTPDDVDALAKLCVGYRVADPAKALEYCRRASLLEPGEMSHAVNFGAALVQAKRYAEAVDLIRKLLTLQPEHATARANLATALFQLKRYPEARTEFQRLTEQQPDSPAAYYFLAIIHDQLEEYLDAMANYQSFLKLADPATAKLDIEKVNLRLPTLQKQIKDGKGKKTR